MGLFDVLMPRRTRAAIQQTTQVAAERNVWVEVEREITRARVSERVAYLSRRHSTRPQSGYNRRSWDPTVSGPLWTDFLGDSASADEEVRNRLKTSREKSRRLARTNPYAARFFALYLANVIGEDGLMMKPRVRMLDGSPDQLANRRLLEEWKAWGERGNCTLDGQLSWREVEDLMAVAWQRDGEALLRIVKGPGLNRWGMVVEPLEADRLDLDYTTQEGENEVRMGVEYQRGTGRVVAYWILNAHPGDYTISRGSARHTRVPADDMVHLFTRDRMGQHRGVPRLEPGMARLHMLAGYEEAEVVASRAASSKFGVVYTETGADYEGDDVEGEPGTGGNDQVAFSDFGQGTVEQLGNGQKFELVNPTHPTTQYGEAVKAFLRGVASALPTNYNSLANDLEGVNYSSLRHATLEERDQWRREQKHFASLVSQDVFEDWLGSALFTGALSPLTPSGFDRYRRVAWGGKRWSWIDPLKEAQGNAASLEFFGKTITEIAEERGRSVDDIAAEIESERETFAKHGIDHPLDRVKAPAAAPGPPTPPDDKGDE